MGNKEGPRSFGIFIQTVGDGRVEAEAAAALQEVINACQDDAVNRQSPSKGELTIKLKFEVQPNGITSIAHDITKKDPKKVRAPAVGWATPGGNIALSPPKQEQLALREVTTTGTSRETESTNNPAREA